MPSSNKAYNTMMTLAEETGTGTIVDLGSGWGNFVIPMAMKCPQRQIIGYELSLLPWLISSSLKKILGLQNLTLYRQDFYQADLSKASVVVCYLFPEAMSKIKDKISNELHQLNFLISNTFALPSHKPCKVMKLDDFYHSPIFLYNIGK
jgi:16S rRNA A1518/A1519 N6-dimethyltransferase RsmA/KsgA/DIM1 with predicted DNA glycosylase/AP lyase activity